MASGSDIDGGQTEAGDDDAGDHTRFGRREPLEGRRGGGGIAEAETGAGEKPETDDPGPVAGRLGDHDKAGTDQQTTEDGGNPRAELILALAGQDHGKGEGQAGRGVRVVDRGGVPGEGALPSLGDRLGNRALEDAPGIEDTQRQVDTGARQGHAPSFRLHGYRLFFHHGGSLLGWNGMRTKAVIEGGVAQVKGERPIDPEGAHQRFLRGHFAAAAMVRPAGGRPLRSRRGRLGPLRRKAQRQLFIFGAGAKAAVAVSDDHGDVVGRNVPVAADLTVVIAFAEEGAYGAVAHGGLGLGLGAFNLSKSNAYTNVLNLHNSSIYYQGWEFCAGAVARFPAGAFRRNANCPKQGSGKDGDVREGGGV